MATPKVNIRSTFVERHKILQPEIHSSTEPVNHKDLTGIMQISNPSRFQGPVTTPSQMKDLQQAEF